ncbi:hypothetical protein Rhe02_95970 [Rhizocola hellebori]|uniref:Uncharacterized protein n=1 Tax=Rhizocola hellebori TaxID=1392758 RepID=A0A8J3VM29_9ACTN|nr:hypothetical protein [Rhizocola hellebori]GIH11530.1 hypothetical protein Rhe02_95970 [Rhizocola hellebori]
MNNITPQLIRADHTIRNLENQLEELGVRHRNATAGISILHMLVSRRTRALWTGFITLEVKAAYEIGTSEWGDHHWLANVGQAIGLFIAAGYVVTPNIRKLLRLASDVPDALERQA